MTPAAPPEPQAHRLEPPEEPADLAAGMRRLALDSPLEARLAVVLAVGDLLAQVWADAPGAAGVTPALVREQAAAYRRELWLWAIGERRWRPTIALLGGRVLRRLPVGAP